MALIAHVVVLTWQPGVTDDEVERIGAAFDDMRAQIPEIVAYSHGPNLRLRKAGQVSAGLDDYGVVAVIDEDDLDTYLDHPAHTNLPMHQHMILERHAVQVVADPVLMTLLDGTSSSISETAPRKQP
jgi:hypothetical protein